MGKKFTRYLKVNLCNATATEAKYFKIETLAF